MTLKTKPSILLIDDSTVDLRVLMEIMAAYQMRAHVAFDGQDGYHKAQLLRPALILLDVTMPVMDGFATCRMLKNNELTRPIPVIFLTASNEVDKRIKGLSLGAVDYIGKPFSEQEVLMRVSIHLQLARQSRALTDQPDACDTVMLRDTVLVRAATDYLRQHISLPPAPEALAKILNTNKKRLNQAFLDEFAMPIFAWLREERLRQARELLAVTNVPLLGISQHLGFASQANFAKAFRERFGCTPSALRVELQKNKPK